MSNDTTHDDKTFKILLDIDHIGNAQAFTEPNEVLQQQGMNDFFEFIKKTLEEAEKYTPPKKSVSFCRRHNTITISGSRGSGKTTFLLNMLEAIQQDKKGFIPQDKEFDCKKIEILGLLDPTLIEDKEHVFINIISRIKESVDQKCPDGPNKREHSQDYRTWRESLKKLAGGLTGLDGVGGNTLDSDAWMDPIHVMEKGLQQVRGSNELEKNFHTYIYHSLKLLDKKAFLLPLDDIDTKFESGWQVLEVLRKYLTTPQLITVLSGDLGLYSKLVRRHQWDNFGDRLLEQEAKSNTNEKKNYTRLVDELEEQYLLKILKPERRILLTTLGEQLRNFNPSTIVVKASDKQETNFTQFFRNLCENGLLQKPLSKEVERLYTDALLNEPIRFVSQLLLAFEKNNNFILKIPDLFRQPLHNLGFQDLFFRNPSHRTYLNTLSVKLAKKGYLQSGHHLLPDTTSRRENLGMIALSAITTNTLTNSPALIFDYPVKMGLTREITRSLPIEDDSAEAMSVTEYIVHTQLENGAKALTHAHLSAVYLRTINSTNQTASSLGTVSTRIQIKKVKITTDDVQKDVFKTLYGISNFDNQPTKESSYDEIDTFLQEKSNNEYALDFLLTRKQKQTEILNSIETQKSLWQKRTGFSAPRLDSNPDFYFHLLNNINKSITSWHANFVTPLFSISQNTKGERICIFSFHALLSTLGETIETTNQSWMGSDSASLASFIRQLSTPIEPPLPTRLKGNADFFEAIPRSGTQDDENESTLQLPFSDDSSDLRHRLSSFGKTTYVWRNNYDTKLKRSTTLTPHFLSRITDRFHSVLSQIDQTLESQHHALGFMTHRFIVAFLNSVLVEEAVFYSSTNVIIKHPVTSDDIFLQNLSKTRETNLPIFRWIFSCPIWGLFIQIHTLEVPEKFNGRKKTEIMKEYITNLKNEGFIHEDTEKPGNTSISKKTFIDMLAVDFYGVQGVFDNLFAPLNSVLLRNVRNNKDNKNV